MKKTLFLLLFAALSSFCFADTIDYWHVFINSTLLHEYNAYSDDFSHVMNKEAISENDSIHIKHGTCIRHHDAIYFVVVKDENGNELLTDSTKRYFGNLSFSLTELIEKGEAFDSKEFIFYYYTTSIMMNEMKEKRGIEIRPPYQALQFQLMIE